MDVTKTTADHDPHYKWRALSSVAIGTFMGPLDASVVNIALPYITSSFSTNLTTAEWVIMSYLLVVSSLLLTYGRLGDMFGHKPVYLTGLSIFTVASALCGLSVNIWMLIAARVLQAIGAGMLMAIGPAITSSNFPPHERGQALGLIGSTVAAALAFGPALGGLLVGHFGWRAIFLINLPIGVIGIIWAAKVLRWKKEVIRQVFDYTGAASLALGLISLLLILSKGQAWGWQSPAVIILGIAGLLAIVLFIRVELKASSPMLDLTLFNNRLFSAANVTALLNFMSQYSVFFLLPFYLEKTRHLAPQRMGLLLMSAPLMILIISPLSGRISDRIGSRFLSSSGMFIITIGLFLFSRITPTTSYPLIILALALTGIGTGLFQSPNNNAIMSSVPKNRLGIASGMMATMRVMGILIGIAVSGAIFAIRHGYYLSTYKAAGISDNLLVGQAFTSAIKDAFLAGGILAIIGVFTSLTRGGQESQSSKNRA